MIAVNARADRVETSRASDGEYVATAVEFTYNGLPYIANATKEVILSAGYVIHAAQ